jgi:hypothetical protein
MPVRIARGKYTTEITWTKLGELLRQPRGAAAVYASSDHP